MDGFDTHAESALTQGTSLFGPLNMAISEFAASMKSQGLWDNVVMVFVSDFGRTLSSNSRGTDHGTYSSSQNTEHTN
jgi:uncharacterized protein (DUF1501 family)